MFKAFLVKYAEIGIKGKNRYLFEDVLAYAIKAEGNNYLAVFTPKTDKAEIPLAEAGIMGADVKVIYPSSGDCKYAVENGKLQVTMPQVTCARLFEIK